MAKKLVMILTCYFEMNHHIKVYFTTRIILYIYMYLFKKWFCVGWLGDKEKKILFTSHSKCYNVIYSLWWLLAGYQTSSRFTSLKVTYFTTNGDPLSRFRNFISLLCVLTRSLLTAWCRYVRKAVLRGGLRRTKN